MKALALAVAMIMPAAAQAEEPFAGFMTGVAACLDASEDEAAARACIGVGSGACMDGAPGGQSTVGMMSCLLAERDAWDVLLNEEYQSARTAARQMDAAEQPANPEFAVRADRLRDAQRAWIAFRDANCAMEYAVWGGGSMRQITGADCQMQMTAERTIQLRSLRQMLTEG
ncbi:lysozyme inhibitor LprI family protein [Pararhodobacter zhoushanensis]|uniref:lysozyme inhibitor LprI family protein n=1 Tax=Pararhodobacter zhoushanensis TaxID=2479545 RepID=UPI000F8E6E0E|nr:lysozyme inhibitor LprI family protein [Pararhodobacter zhoushanensis]